MRMDFANGPRIAAVIPHQKPATGLCYHNDGVHLFASCEDDSRLYMINAQTGKCDSPAIRCERDGIRLVSSTHHDQCVLLAGKGSTDLPISQRHSLNYMSVYDNKVLRKFRGHSDLVTKISLSPADDTFLTSSKDRTVRLWNVQQAGCLGKMDLPKQTEGTPCSVFDSTGLVFAIMAGMAGGEGYHLHLYDARNYSGGAFSELKVTKADIEKAMATQRVSIPSGSSIMNWRTMQFNASGSRILVESDPGIAIVLDGYESTVQRIFHTPKPTQQSSTVFTPDDKSVIMGADDGKLYCWDVENGALLKTLEGHRGPIGALACNPKYAQIASSCSDTCLWLW
uniref:Anaphase-promoting complex subunit 4 WD40 domain-containing protein n=1 Tax=Craspedostauros australis TaxID=1486917 RepID=A0A7R9ZRD4_9STRA|mmetsp:Transcript_6993/g.18990  ORF Transcript_6993/g.18990 Transcript_6993/m.18990 type:complete len:339 (+) Transcript_6993:110-1126(+)